MAKNDVTVTLRLRDLATKGLRSFRREVKGAERDVSNSAKRMERSFRQMAQSVDRNTRQSTRSVDRGSKRMKADLKSTSTQATATGASFGKMSALIAAAYVGIRAAQASVGAGFGFVKAAAQAEETINRFGVSFGERTSEIEARIRVLGLALGRSADDLRDYAANYQILLTSLGFARDEAADLSVALTELQLDLASYRDLLDEDVAQKLFSGLVGEAEAVRRLGPDISAAAIEQAAFNIGVEVSVQNLTQQEKVLLRIIKVFEDTEQAQGDLARTQTSFTNQVKRLLGRLSEFRVEIGEQMVAAIRKMIEQLGGADEIAGTLAYGMQVLSFITLGFIRAVASTIQSVRQMMESFGGAEQVMAFVGERVATLIKRFEILKAAVQLVVEVIGAGFRAIRDIVTANLKVVLTALSDSFAAMEDFARFVGVNLKEAAEGARAALAALDQLGGGDTALGRVEQAITEISAAVRTFDRNMKSATESERALNASFRNITAAVTGLIRQFKLAPNPEDLIPEKADISGLRDLFNSFRTRVAGDKEAEEAEEKQVERVRDLTSSYLGATEALRVYGQSLSNFALANDFVTGLFRTLEQGVQSFSRALVDSSISSSDAVKRLVQDLGALIIQMTILSGLRDALGFGPGGGIQAGGLASFIASLFGTAPSAGTVTGSSVAGLDGGSIPLGGGLLDIFEKGGVGPGPLKSFTDLPVKTYASGGVATSPQIGIFGEGRQNEAFVPLPDGKKIPVDMKGGGAPTINLNVQSIDPSTAADTVLQAMPQIQAALTTAIATGADRKLQLAIRGS